MHNENIILNKAISYFQKNNFKKSTKILNEVLSKNNRQPDAFYFLGLINIQNKQYKSAANFISTAISINPNHPAYYFSLGITLHKSGQIICAIKNYSHALKIKPDLAEAHFNLGVALLNTNDVEGAILSYQRAIKFAPQYLDAYLQCGIALFQRRKFNEAIAYFKKTLQLDPNHLSAKYHLASSLEEIGDINSATDIYQQLIHLTPQDYRPYFLLANLLKLNASFEDALYNYNQCIKLNSTKKIIYFSRGIVFLELSKFHEAVSDFEKVIRLDSNYYDAYVNLGLAQQYLCQYQNALDNYDRAITISPNSYDAYWNKSINLLLTKNFKEGWASYEKRYFKAENFLSLCAITNQWNGDKFDGSLLVLSEQGIGDIVLYSSMFHELAEFANSITVIIDPRLLNLFRRSFKKIHFLSPHNFDSSFFYDMQIYMGSLGQYLRPNINAFQNVKNPYLFACARRSQNIKQKISIDHKLICGVSWKSKAAKYGEEKSLTLKTLSPILELNTFDFISLQYGDTSSEEASLNAETNLSLIHLDDIDNFNDIDGLTALISACDVVVTTSNTTAHLACALGKKTLIMLPYSTGLLWYWHIDRDDSLWYPSADLFRQEKMNDWSNVIEKVKDHLSALSTKISRI